MTPPASRTRIIIVGGGFAGTITAIKIIDLTTHPLDITILEPRESIGRGVAYSTPNPDHLVNAPAQNFSLYPEDPQHLARWLENHGSSHGWTPPIGTSYAESFPPRFLFGTYVQEEITRSVRESRDRVTIRHIRTRASDIGENPAGVRVSLDDGTSLEADIAVLANGLLSTAGNVSVAPALTHHPAYIADPFAPNAFDHVGQDGSVLFLGASLTMLDALISMEAKGFVGHYRALSRRGLLVQRNRLVQPWPDVFPGNVLPRSLAELLRIVQTQRRAIAAVNEDWRRLPAAIRPRLPELWAAATTRERVAFARRLRPFWDTALHRAAPKSYDILDLVLAEGRFNHGAGTVLSLQAGPAGQIVVLWQPPGGTTREDTFDLVVSCLGNGFDWRSIPDRLVRRLVQTGFVRPHDTGYGIDAEPHTHAIIDAAGRMSRRTYAVGHPLRGLDWESSSIREQIAGATLVARAITTSASQVQKVA